MNVITVLKNLFKARFGTFTKDELDALCKEYSEKASVFSDEGKGVEKVLGIYFRRITPDLTALNVIYGYNDELRWLYLKSLSDKRKLTIYEQKYLAAFMNFGPVYHFPQQLDIEAVAHLFEVGDVNRIATYVCDFVLPERYELELIKRYTMQKPYTSGKLGKCDYRCVLERYLSNRKPEVCKSVRVQNELLKFADGAIWEMLCANQSMTENVLEKNTICELIAKGYRNSVRTLLMHSFIPTAELQRYLLSAFPTLKWELEISKLRYALRKLELETGEFWGVETPSFEEMKLIENWIEFSEETPREMAKAAHKKIVLCEPVTPYFCAWIVNEYSPAGEEMYTCLRKFAESCRQKYGKSV